jgi:hypothetical protein
MRYNETLPLVVWIDDHPLRWSDARAALMRNARVAIAVVPQSPDAAFWNEVSKTKWIDARKTYFVGAPGRTPAASEGAGRAAVYAYKPIIEDNSVKEGFYREDSGAIRVGKVQSFAAGYIAHELNSNGFR